MIKLRNLLFEALGYQIYIPYVGEKFQPNGMLKVLHGLI